MAGRKRALVKNANRRLGDRLWSAEGVEYSREMLSGYYLPGAELAVTMATRSPKIALLRDHSSIEWPDLRRFAGLLKDISADGKIMIGGRPFRPTLWNASDGTSLVLFEEWH